MRRLTHLFLKFRFTHSSSLDSRPILQTSTQSKKSRIWYWRGNSTVLNQDNRETSLSALSPLLARLLFDECFNRIHLSMLIAWGSGQEVRKIDIFYLSRSTLGWERRRICVCRFSPLPPLRHPQGGVTPDSPNWFSESSPYFRPKTGFPTPVFLPCLKNPYPFSDLVSKKCCYHHLDLNAQIS